ncbi:hypothetical protein JTB14_001235 [Gonioctena quinquepunctata]|nr:hypothetical protein JTB14_001235 [Gonioctena quinquepunctata]
METNQGEILEESVSPTIAPEAILEIVNDEHEQNEQPNKNQETDGTEYKRNVFPLSDIDGELVATTSRKRFSESNESAPRKRIKKAHRFIGDWNSEDMESNENRKQFFRVAQKKIAQQKKKIKSLQQKNRRLKFRVDSLQSLTKYLRRRNFISEQAESTLNASLTDLQRNYMIVC